MNALPDNVVQLGKIVADCTLCPRCCHVNRVVGEVGACNVGALAVVASSGPHFGEEPCLVGSGGSGTIFFSGCNLDCIFCQNYDISHRVVGQEVTGQDLARIALRLQRQGCENINFVTPTHVAHVIAEAIVRARDQGLTVPTVYNTGGYDSPRTLRLLEGLIDIYMPDFKWADESAGVTYSHAPGYPSVARAAVEEMFRQVGPLKLDERGCATSGLLVRHLVMPGDLAHSRDVLNILAEAAPGAAVNVMAQYYPAYRANEYPELMERPSLSEIRSLRKYAMEKGLVLIGG